MKKEIVLAIIFGLLVGLVVTFSIYYNKNKDKPTGQNSATANRIALEPIQTSNLKEADTSPIKITQPLDESVQTDKTITLTGEAVANNYVVVFVNDKETITQTDGSGAFSIEINLESGSNIIGVYTINENGETLTNQVTVIHSNKSLEEKLVSDSEVKVEADKEK